MGGLVAVLAMRSFLQPHPWDYWVYPALGVWTFEVAWFLGSAGWGATLAHVAASLVLAAIPSRE